MIDRILDTPEIWCVHIDLPNSPLRNLNAYVIKTDSGNLVIDTGFNRKECKEALFDGLNQLNIDLSKTSLFLTHFHADHIGLVQEFVNHGCTVYMGRLDYEYLYRLFHGETSFNLSEILLEEDFPAELLELQAKKNVGRRYAPSQIFPAVCVEHETEIMLGDVKLVCIHTPGHTPGHMMLYMPEEQVLFTGDHVLFNITPNISIWKTVIDSLGDYIDSLKKTKEIPVRIVLPAHRTKHIGLKERIDQILEHHEERLQEILNVVEQNPGATAYEIAGSITWSMKGKKWNEAPADQKWFAMGETLAHLYYLLYHNEAERKEVRGRIGYYKK